ncbi:hypothetical protein AU467_12855 [Mesorhizobium loti]|uniref:Uncharacterized protein n=1 Tax=Rhizobium loti TaxID=381 RepID=A0A101KWD1_RHILI|nr:hypothetical protein AU467_12855 [Mesorhizobium loti]
MEEVTSEQIYGLLKRVDQQLGELSKDFSEVKSELGSIRGHIIATEHDLKNIYRVMTRQNASLERIERRLVSNQSAEAQRP